MVDYLKAKWPEVKKKITSPQFLFMLGVVVVALIVRLVMLNARPVHHDEGINGWWVDWMWEHGYYNYDPANYHGPVYFYLLQFARAILGRSVWIMRFTTVLISMVGIIYVGKHKRFFGWPALWAALFMAVGSAFVFYNKYAIHESLLIVSQIIFSYGFFLYLLEKKKRAGMAYMMLGFFLAYMTKETFFVYFIGFFVAFTVFYLLDNDFKVKHFKGDIEYQTTPLSRSSMLPVLQSAGLLTLIVASLLLIYRQANMKSMLNAAFLIIAGVLFAGWLWFVFNRVRGELQSRGKYPLSGEDRKFFIYTLYLAAAGFGVSVFFFTGMLMDGKGFVDMFSTFLVWSSRGASDKSGYVAPFEYFLKLILEFEPLVLFSILSLFVLSFTSSKWNWFWGVLGLAVLYAYSLIPYKTPWLILNTIWPLYFIGGYALVSIWRARVIAAKLFLLLVFIGFFIFQLYTSWKLNFVDYADVEQKYLYTHTHETISTMMDHVDDLTDYSPKFFNISISVYIKETWPLPYLFGKFPNQSFQEEKYRSMHYKKHFADLVIIDKRRDGFFRNLIREPYFREEGLLRPAYTEIVIYYRKAVFEKKWKGEKIIVEPKLVGGDNK